MRLHSAYVAENSFAIFSVSPYNDIRNVLATWRLLSPERGCADMSEFDTILFLVVATGYILAITKKK